MNRWILDHSQAMKDAWKRTSGRLTPFVVLVLLLGILLALPGWGARAHGKCSRKETACSQVRVKRCGKNAPRDW